MWDSIQLSKEWIFSQIPTLIKQIYESDISQVQKKFSQQISEDEIDYSTIALCYVNIIAGAIFSLGFKYAGTGKKEQWRARSRTTRGNRPNTFLIGCMVPVQLRCGCCHSCWCCCFVSAAARRIQTLRCNGTRYASAICVCVCVCVGNVCLCVVCVCVGNVCVCV